MIKLSVIVPIYNMECFIRDCLNSLVDQGMGQNEYEILCIDDGSTDNSALIVREYAKKYSYIRLLQKENGGIASSRNYGVENAIGDYVTYVDSDDFLEKNSLKRIMSCLDEEFSICCFGYRCVTDEDHYTEYVNDGELSIKSIPLSYKKAPRQVWGTIVKRELYKKYKLHFNQALRTREDYIVNLLLFASCTEQQLLLIENHLYQYRIRNGSLSHCIGYRTEEFQKERMMNLIKYIEECNNFLDINSMQLNDCCVTDIKRIVYYYTATSLFSSLRCKTISSGEAKKLVRDAGGKYPIPLYTIDSGDMLVKVLATAPGVYDILKNIGVLSSRTIC